MCNRSDDEENLRSLKYFTSHTGLQRGASPGGFVETLSTLARTNDNVLRTGWHTSRRISETHEEASPEENCLVGNFRLDIDRELEESSVSSQEMAPSPSVRSLAWGNTTVFVILGNKKSSNMQFKKPVVTAADILERIEEIHDEHFFQKLKLPTDMAQVCLTRNDHLLQSGDELMDGDVVYALSKSEANIKASSDEKKENMSSSRQKNVDEFLKKFGQRHRPRMRPGCRGTVFQRKGNRNDSEDFTLTPSSPCPLKSYMSLSSKDFMHEEVRKPSPASKRVMIQELKAQIHELENKSNDYKLENEELRNLVRQTLTQTKIERDKLNEMECSLKLKKIEVSSLSARSEELLKENKKLIEERCAFEQTAKELELQIDNEKKYTNVMGMGITLPKDIPKDQEKLEKTIDALQQLIRELRNKQLENYKRRMQCTICYDRKWDTALIPCGHCLCSVCARRLTSCHLCRKNIERRQKMATRNPNVLKNFDL